jgi:hypothetical protein
LCLGFFYPVLFVQGEAKRAGVFPGAILGIVVIQKCLPLATFCQAIQPVMAKLIGQRRILALFNEGGD